MKRSEQQIANLLEPTINALGLQLWGVEHLTRGRQSLLRIYIESEQGVGIEDCERVSRQVGALLDVEDPIAGEYALEVSSPGMDRRLFKIGQYAHYMGSEVSVKLRSPVAGRRNFKGKVAGVTDSHVVVDVDGQEHSFPFEEIERANIVF